MGDHFDVVIVGGRCAGASLACMLARKSVRTLVLEQAPLGSDMQLSTHQLQPPALDVLDELGVGQQVRKAAPACPRMRLQADRGGVSSCTRCNRQDRSRRANATAFEQRSGPACRDSVVDAEQRGFIRERHGKRDIRDPVLPSALPSAAASAQPKKQRIKRDPWEIRQWRCECAKKTSVIAAAGDADPTPPGLDTPMNLAVGDHDVFRFSSGDGVVARVPR